ncbi:DUF2716 domain-containing protein [Aquisphaera insulae]|uniref:DUF2716 domain-containing protein n=1 Tax=Aquisphaera insulae TaxID=2712864 RepID=UPI0013EA30B7|nr:DUF2716 domain-containing protein [Aquisphaera insulae]
MYPIWDAWTTRFGHYERSGGDPVFPPPFRTWDLAFLSRLPGELEEIESDLTMRILAAFRHCTPRGERLWAIEHWQHTWYEFDPHGGITAATRDEWALPIFPDGDSYHFVAMGFSYGVSGDRRGKLTVFGETMLAALDANGG